MRQGGVGGLLIVMLWCGSLSVAHTRSLSGALSQVLSLKCPLSLAPSQIGSLSLRALLFLSIRFTVPPPADFFLTLSHVFCGRPIHHGSSVRCLLTLSHSLDLSWVFFGLGR